MTSIDDLDVRIRNAVDYIFYDGPKKGTPSTIVHLEGNTVHVQPRTGSNSGNAHKKVSFPVNELSKTK
jgi:tRNA A37 threonylcarbamoyladenosine synthetase subunit TsaC/SUA5/YrdC